MLVAWVEVAARRRAPAPRQPRGLPAHNLAIGSSSHTHGQDSGIWLAPRETMCARTLRLSRHLQSPKPPQTSGGKPRPNSACARQRMNRSMMSAREQDTDVRAQAGIELNSRRGAATARCDRRPENQLSAAHDLLTESVALARLLGSCGDWWIHHGTAKACTRAQLSDWRQHRLWLSRLYGSP
jgi:hypothetical protein